MTSTHLLALLLLTQQTGQAESPRVLSRQVADAIAGDTVSRVEAQWDRRARREPNDRAALFGLATLARLQYDYSLAEARYRRLYDPDFSSPDRYATHALIGAGLGYQTQGLLLDAEPWFRRAAEMARALGDSAAEAEAVIEMSVVRGRSGDPTQVLGELAAAESFIPRGDSWLTAAYQCRRARVLGLLNRPETLDEALAGVELARRTGDLRLAATCRHVVATYHTSAGHMESASDTLNAIQEVQRAVGDRAGLAVTLQWSGYINFTVGRYGPSLRLLRESVREAEASRNLAAIAWASINLANIALGLSDYQSAAAHLARAQTLLQQTGDKWGWANTRLTGAGLSAQSGDTAAARSAYEEVLQWARDAGQVWPQVNATNGLATLAVRQGDWEAAERRYAANLSLREQHGLTGWAAGDLFDLGEVALRRGQLDSAQVVLDRAVRALHPEQTGFRYKLRLLLAELQLRRGDTVLAAEEFMNATDALDEWRAYMSDREQRLLAFQWRTFLGGPAQSSATLVAGIAAAGMVDEAFHLNERRRARELRDQILRDEASRLGSLELDTFVHVPAKPIPGALEVVAALPNRRTALLEYVTGPVYQPTTLFVLTAGGADAHFLPPIDSLSAEIGRFTALTEDGDAPGDIAAHLGAVLLGPAIAHLPDSITHLIVAADGVLHRLPFDALRLEDGRLLVERFAVSMTPSAAVAVEIWTRPPNRGDVRILALGDPDFSPTEADTGAVAEAYRAAFEDRGGLDRLRGSAREAKRVGRYASESEVRLRRDASEAYLKSGDLEGVRVLHLATHALVDEWSVARTALALAPGGGEDGFLGPSDLASLRLNADLVVLSACRTAGGVVLGGEGVQGLASPMLEAGARTVVATGWEIGDASARRFVDRFYKAIASGETAVDALRAAKLESLRNGDPARDWAVFTLMGDPFVRIPLTKPPWWKFW